MLRKKTSKALEHGSIFKLCQRKVEEETIPECLETQHYRKCGRRSQAPGKRIWIQIALFAAKNGY